MKDAVRKGDRLDLNTGNMDKEKGAISMNKDELEEKVYKFMIICLMMLASALFLSIACLLVYLTGKTLGIFL